MGVKWKRGRTRIEDGIEAGLVLSRSEEEE
jgi:hypothetical protein